MRIERVAFDLYGTLLNIGGLAERLKPIVGSEAEALLAKWRKAQIERTWRLNEEAKYEPFDAVTANSLAEVAPQLSAGQRRQAESIWNDPPAYPDAKAALEQLKKAKIRRIVLSNGTLPMIQTALQNAGLEIDEVKSADEVKAYKTDPRVYELVPKEGTLFVSGNGWDAEGATKFGLSVAWLDRGGPKPGVPTALHFHSLSEVAAHVVHREHGVRVVHASELDPNTAQTPGMDRKAAINFAKAGAEKLWAGTVTIHPNAKTGAHHHGPVESVIYVVRGRARMRWGDALQYTAEAGPGDFIFVPPYVPHQEINAAASEPLDCVLVRSGQEPVVVNLDLKTVEPPEEVKWIDDLHKS
jgi:2-haloalkanoic acid dehalogenase type II